MTNPQLKGLENLEGTYVFDIRTSNKALNLNRFLWHMIKSDWRDRYRADPEALMTESRLSDEEKTLVRNEDWIGLIRYGACFFVLEKLARVVGKTNLEVYAMMRGETYEEFMKTRRVPGAT